MVGKKKYTNHNISEYHNLTRELLSIPQADREYRIAFSRYHIRTQVVTSHKVVAEVTSGNLNLRISDNKGSFCS